MSDLTSIEKLKLETLLDMGSGYVLDFSNKTFQEFILENSNIDIYDDKYYFQSGSKANRLRAFWKEKSNQIVGRLLESLLEFWRVKRLIDKQGIRPEEHNLFNECKNIVERLTGITSGKVNENFPAKEKLSLRQSELLLKFDSFASLTDSEDKKKRGVLLEDLLKKIFSFYGITAKKSFRRNEGGEQIDGAFKLEGSYFLVECKWTEKLTDIRASLKIGIGRTRFLRNWDRHIL